MMTHALDTFLLKCVYHGLRVPSELEPFTVEVNGSGTRYAFRTIRKAHDAAKQYRREGYTISRNGIVLLRVSGRK